MKQRTHRLIKWTAWGLGGAFVVSVAALLFALTTEPGARIALRMVTARLPLDLQFNGMEGSLRGPLSLTDLSVVTPTMEVRAERLMFDLRPFQLIRGRVHLDSARLAGVHVRVIRDSLDTTAATTSADTLDIVSSDSVGFELPVAVAIEVFHVVDGSLSISDSVNLSDITLMASGTHDDYQVTLNATLSAPHVGQAHVRSSGRGTLSEFNLDSLRATVLDGEVRGSGAVSWRTGVEWQAILVADSLIPAALAPNPEDRPGHISLHAEFDGSLTDGDLALDARVDTLFGTMRDQPVMGIIEANVRNSEYTLDQVHLDWGPARLDAAGVADSDRLDLEFELRAPDLGALLPRSSGFVSANGSVTGSPSAPIVTATAEANAVVLDQLKLSHAHARINVDWRDRGRTEVDLRIDDLVYADQVTDSVVALLNGTREAHELRAGIANQAANIQLIASGGMNGSTWSGVLGDIAIETPSAGSWKLEAASSLTASRNAITLEELCMRAEEGDFCARGNWESQAEWYVRSSMNELPLSLLRPLLPEALCVDGQLSGDMSATGVAGVPTHLELDLTPGSGAFSYAVGDTAVILSYREARLEIIGDVDSTRASLNAQLTETDATDFGSVGIDVRLASLGELIDRTSTTGFVSALTEEWTVQAYLDRIPTTLVSVLLPHPLSVTGTVSGHLRTAGQEGTPEYLELELRPSDGSVTYAFQDSTEVIRHREAQLILTGAGDSLYGTVSMKLARDVDADFGNLSAEFSLSSLAELIDRVAADSGVNSLTGEWTLSSSLDSISILLARPLLPDSLSIDGTISGRLSIAGTALMPDQLDLELRPSPGVFVYRLRDTTTAVSYRDAELTLSTEGDGVRSGLRLQIADTNDLEFGTLTGVAQFPSLTQLFDEISVEGLVAALRHDWELSSSVDQIPLAIFNSFVPGGATLAGSLDGLLEVQTASDGTISGRLELQPRTATSQRYFGNDVHTIRLLDTQVRARAGSEGVRGEATFAVARPGSALQGTVSASVALPQLRRLDQPLRSQPVDATVRGEMDLSLLDELFDDFSGSAGRLEVDLRAGNTVGEMEVSGNYQLRGQTDVVSLGIDLRDIDIRASDSPEGGLEIEGSVSSGGGRLTVEGTSPSIPTRESPARLTIRGADFQALRTEQVDLVVSPDVQVLVGGNAIDVRGEINVPRARIELLEVPQVAVSPSRDVVYVGQTDAVDSQPLDVTAEVNLTLGENVVFRGFGFNTHLEGSVLASEQPGRVTRGRGELVFREGIYRGYGQNLSVDPGRLVFAGPMDDPAVDVLAYRRATDGTRAGFMVGGTLKSLDVEVWSDPAKTDSDALSYIMFGRPMSQGTEADQFQAGNAAAILGGNMLAMSMASRVGLDDARIETGARQQETAFYAGKYLSPRLYVAYGVGLYEPINVLRVRYLLSRKFTLQVETGTRDSGDILYRIEF